MPKHICPLMARRRFISSTPAVESWEFMISSRKNHCAISYIMYDTLCIRGVFGGDARTSGEEGLSAALNNEMRPCDAMVERLRDRAVCALRDNSADRNRQGGPLFLGVFRRRDLCGSLLRCDGGSTAGPQVRRQDRRAAQFVRLAAGSGGRPHAVRAGQGLAADGADAAARIAEFTLLDTPFTSLARQSYDLAEVNLRKTTSSAQAPHQKTNRRSRSKPERQDDTPEGVEK